MATLKAQILTLWCRGREYDEIVELMGVRREYVRACVSRARHGGCTPGDIASRHRYAARKRERYHADPDYRRAQLAKSSAYRKANLERLRAYDRARHRRRRDAQTATAPLGTERGR